MYSKYPQLKRDTGALYLPLLHFTGHNIYDTSAVKWAQWFDKDMQEIEKYPDIEQETWALTEMHWMHAVNRGMWDLPRDMGDRLESLTLSGSKTGCHLMATVLRTIRQNLNLNKNNPLYQNTVKALEKNKKLNKLMPAYLDQQKISLAKTIEHKNQISLGKVKKPVFPYIIKYL